jgi:hypothetical protein
MVGGVTILNKRLFDQPHKRSSAATGQRLA